MVSIVFETKIGANPTDGSSTRRIFRQRHQGARNRQHLLFAPAHTSRQLPSPFLQARERIEAKSQAVRDARACKLAKRAEQEILFHRQLGKQPASLRDERYPDPDDILGALIGQIVRSTVDGRHDASGRGANLPHDAFDQRALPIAVGSEQNDSLPTLHNHADAGEHPNLSVSGMQSLNGKTIRQDKPFRLLPAA